jgi:hypothetical protein
MNRGKRNERKKKGRERSEREREEKERKREEKGKRKKRRIESITYFLLPTIYLQFYSKYAIYYKDLL